MKNSIFIFLIISFTSCFINSKNMKIDEITFVEVKSDFFKENVHLYYKDILKSADFEYALMVEMSILESSIKTEIYYQMNLFGFVEHFPAYYTIVDDMIIFFKNEPVEYIIISKKSKNSLLENIYPYQYDYYINKGFYPPPTTYTGEKWTFINGVLKNKEPF
jgi:hypothetical protein